MCAESQPGFTHSFMPRVTGLYGPCSQSQLIFSSFEYVLLLIFRVPEVGGSRHRSGCLCTGVYLWIASHVWKLVA